MGQNDIEIHPNWKPLFELLKTMLVHHKHRFSIVELNILSTYLEELSFYYSIWATDKMPNNLLFFIQSEQEKILYFLSETLDKYTLEHDVLQKLIVEFEVLKSEITF
jgi:hypothetical protein